MKKELLIATICSFVILSMHAQSNMSFQSWDGNNDGSIDKNEFLVNATKFDRWDENRDNRLSTDEFQKAFFKLYDSDGDENISQDEFQKIGSQVQSNISISAFDKNGDMNISKDEFVANINSIFNTWDGNSDNYISKNEFYDKIFSWWDTDKSGRISSLEFDQIKNSMDKSFWDKIF